MVPPERVQVVEQGDRGDRRYTRYRVSTPKGDLTITDFVTVDVDTVRTVEPLIKVLADAEMILSVLCRFDRPDLTGFLDDRQRENFVRFIKAGVKYGDYAHTSGFGW
jgi:hypothetical protein